MKNAIFFHMAKHSVRYLERPATRRQTGTQKSAAHPQPLPHSSQRKLDFMTGAVGVSIVNGAVVVALGAVMHNKIRIYIRTHAFAFAFVRFFSLILFSLRILIKHEKWRVQLPKMMMHTVPG